MLPDQGHQKVLSVTLVSIIQDSGSVWHVPNRSYHIYVYIYIYTNIQLDSPCLVIPGPFRPPLHRSAPQKIRTLRSGLQWIDGRGLSMLDLSECAWMHKWSNRFEVDPCKGWYFPPLVGKRLPDLCRPKHHQTSKVGNGCLSV